MSMTRSVRRSARRRARAAAAALLAAGALLPAAGCVGKEDTQKMVEAFERGGTRPDEYPVMLNKDLPFQYPPALYAKRVQGNVTLRIFIDENGKVRPDSTRVEEPSGYPALDSAAIRGSQELRFVPAKRRGEPVAVTVLFPVYFRHPEAPGLPGDTILKRQGSGARD
jgi:TonB family protein